MKDLADLDHLRGRLHEGFNKLQSTNLLVARSRLTPLGGLLSALFAHAPSILLMSPSAHMADDSVMLVPLFSHLCGL
jgi:hypothetical protein